MAPTSATDESIPFVSPIPPIARLDKIIDPTATNPAASFHFHSDDERRRRIFRFLEGSSPFGARYEEFSIFLILLWVITSTVSSVFLSTSTYHVASDACDSWCDAVWAGIGSTVIVKTFVVGVFTIDYIMRIFTADLIDPAKYSGLLGRLRFMISFLALADLISIVPFYIDAFHLPNTELGASAIFLRMFRLLRMAHIHQPKTMSVVAFEASSFGGRRESDSFVINAVVAAPNLVSGIDQAQHQIHWGGSMGVQYQSTTKQEGWSSITLHSISAMPQYGQKSFEELRLEDYMAGNRGAKGLTATVSLPGLGGCKDGQAPPQNSSPSNDGTICEERNIGGTRVAQYQTTTKLDGNSSIILHSISAMPQYLQKSFEELRLEDYMAGNRGVKGRAAAAPLPDIDEFDGLVRHYSDIRAWVSEIDISLNGLGQSESPVVIDNSSQSNDDCVDFVEYQEPRINCHYTNNSDDETLRLISTNDPCVTGLYVGDNYWATRAEQLGSALAQNSHLLKLHICYENMNMNSFVLDAFFQALALNRSIQHLTLACFDLSIVDIIQILGPFFQSNQNLRCLHISQSRNFILTSFLPLFQCKSTRLERLVLEGNGFQDRQAADLINAMHFESGLRHLSEIRWGSDHIGRFGCIALSKLLRSPATKLRRLNLPSTNLNDADISSLVGALANNSTLIELGLADQKLVTPFGWRSLSYVFSRRNCSLTTINLSRNNVGDDGVIAIGYSLAAVKTRRKGINLDLSACDFVTLTGWQGFASYLSASSLVGLDISGCSVNDDASAVVVTACIRSSSLRSLAMRGMESISAAGWMLCFHALKASDFALDKLEIGFNNIDDRGAEMLFNRLENASLDKLGMGDSTSITPAGWSTCFRSLLQSNTTVETLDLSCNNIDDEGAALLPGLLPRLRTLRLNLIENVLISANGWSLFTDVLRPDSASLLNNLAIGSEIRGEVDDNVVASFAEGLVQNTSLRSLEIFSDAISSRGWSALANALCDNSSIVNMCSSNHTLGTCWVNAGLPHSLLSLLDLNYNEDKADVIRAKILMHFFSDIDNIGQVFAQVPMSTMPNAIEWIGRDRLGLSTMYILLRNFPSIVG